MIRWLLLAGAFVSCVVADGLPMVGGSGPHASRNGVELFNGSEMDREAALNSSGLSLPGSLDSVDWSRFRVVQYVDGRVVVGVTWDSPRVGLLALIDDRGAVAHTVNTARIESIRQLDLDGDGTPELLVESFGAGAGVAVRRYHLYALRQNEIVEIWCGVATSSQSASGRTEQTTSTLRFEFEAGSAQARLIHHVDRRLSISGGQEVRERSRSVVKLSQ